MRLLKTFLFLLITFHFTLAQDFKGFFDFHYNNEAGTIWLEIPESKLNQEFLYVSSLSAGLGSNDIGLDRGQLGDTKIVKFIKAGDKILLIQPNQDYRAISDNPLEQASVEEAFAQSVIFGFPLTKKKSGSSDLRINLTPFLIRDAHDVVGRLKSKKQGSYKLENSRSAVWIDRTKAFPKNSEFEALLTFVGEPKGAYIRSVAPDAKTITVRQHHSFIQLPDDGYQKRAFHSASGFNYISYYDYATPISSPLEKRYIARHRLEKKDPAAAMSEAVEPIIYYLDPGCPEPIKSALLDGARWWNQAFEAAGFIDAFQVKILPEGADMMDVRYNVIQWVHRSTRGWSYGASVKDPRTGEIIKGHVSLGSLRVRQDYMIAQGILSPYGSRLIEDPMLELALARLRQLSAHEIGHTIGLAHNFAASANDRASVMDYPHPVISLDDNGDIKMADAYDDKIGAWDKQTIKYGYSVFSEEKEQDGLEAIIKENKALGLGYITDQDARPLGGAHPYAHLWDNGSDPISEFDRIVELRKDALSRFGEHSIPDGTPLSELEKVLIPVYYMHRYQQEAVVKLIGGIDYSYAIKGEEAHPTSVVSVAEQKEALDRMIRTLEPEFLSLPLHIQKIIPPAAFGFGRNRETSKGHTGLPFDANHLGYAGIQSTISQLLHPQRITRLHQQGNAFNLQTVLDAITLDAFKSRKDNLYSQYLIHTFYMHLVKLVAHQKVNTLVSATLWSHVETIELQFMTTIGQQKRYAYLLDIKEKIIENPDQYPMGNESTLPPGSPIGCGHMH